MKKNITLLLCFFICANRYVNAQVIPSGVSLDTIYFGQNYNGTQDVSLYTVYYYKPASYVPGVSPILFAIHGDMATGMSPINDLTAIADRRQALIIAPNLLTSGNIRLPEATYLYIDSVLNCGVYGPATNVLKTMYRHVLARESLSNTPAYLIGWSAGAQFVTRYMLIRQSYPDSIPFQMAVSGNPGFYTFPTDSFNGSVMPWPCGLNFDNVTVPSSDCIKSENYYSFNCSQYIRQYYNENYGVLIGTADNQPYLTGCPTNQGISRYERAVNFFNFADSNAITLGTTLQWQYREVVGVAHSQSQMYNTKLLWTDTSSIAESLLFDTPHHPVPALTPIADFYSLSQVAGPNGVIQFINTSTQATNYTWDFGDGTTSPQTNPIHTYTIAGQYDVQLIANGAFGCGGWNLKKRYITIPFSIAGNAEKFQKKFKMAGAFSTDGYFSGQNDDNSFYLAGSANKTDGTDYIYLIKIQTNGDTLWTKVWGGTGTEYCRNAKKTNDGGYILTGSTTSFGAGNKDIFLLKADATGNISWLKSFGSTGNDNGYAVEQTSDSGFIMGGDYPQGAFLIKTNSNGDTLWTRLYNSCERISSVKQTSDGGYICSGGIYSLFIFKLDSSGNTQWIKTLPGSATSGFSIAETNNNEYIISGQYVSGTVYARYLIKTDSSGNILWAKDYEVGSEGQVLSCSDGSFVLSGIKYGAYGLSLIKTDSNGNSIWAKAYGFYPNINPSVLSTNDNGFIIGASDLAAFGCIVKTDSLGNSGCNDSTVTITPTVLPWQTNSIAPIVQAGCIVNSGNFTSNSGFTVITACSENVGLSEILHKETTSLYPNPSHDICNIISDYDFSRLKIYNLMGETVLTNNYSGGTKNAQVNLLNLTPGIYFVEIVGVQKRTVKKLVVE